MANKIIWGHDLYKGFKLDSNTLLNGAIDDLLPFQMLTLDEKSEDWIRAVADYYETCGWGNVERKAHKIQKNFWLRHGKLDQSDYIINPEVNPLSQAIGMIVPPESTSPLQQFYPLIPNFVDVLRGEFIKRDNTWTIEAIDPFSINAAFENKSNQFREIMSQMAMLEKQQSMAEMGLTPEVDPEQYQAQMQEYMKRLQEVELEAKNFRTTGAKWADKVIRIHEKRYNLSELEPDAFESMLIADREFWHLDLLDDDFKLELLNPKWCDYHKGPNVKYVSDGDYFLWFDFMSAGDVVNKFGRRMTEDDLLKLKDIYVKTANMIVPDYLKSRGTTEYYDLSKPWSQATDLNPAMNDALLGKELAYSYMRSPNFDHNQDVDIFNPVWGRMTTGTPQMFRVMRLYWRSMRRIGWLTKINRDGTRPDPDWIDENYKVTEEPVYDNSVIKDKTKSNLLYGEHIDWTWVNEWRHVIKISPNQKHTFWMNSQNTLSSIYIDGSPVKFQFKGRNNPFDSLPPVEGCEFSYLNTNANSFVDRAKPLQILYNISMNKVPNKILNDYGNKLAIDRRHMQNFSMNNSTNSLDPVEAYEDKLMNSPILDYTLDAESLRLGQPALPQVLQLSTVQEAQFYFTLAQNIKWEAGELIGISRQRTGGAKASEAVGNFQAQVNFSETQTEKYYEQHGHLMQRVRQRMLDATQYYTTFNESNRDIYMNESHENVWLEINGMDNLLPQYNLYLESKANVRAALQKISQFLIEENTLPIKPSAKIGAIVEQSLPKLLSLIKEGEMEAEQREDAQRAHELQLEQEKRNTLLAQLDQQKQQKVMEKQMDYQRETDVAAIRSAGGIQTDVNANGNPDAMDNLNILLKQQDIDRRSSDNKHVADLKRKSDVDKNMVEREKAAMKLEGEKYKADKTLEVAKENKVGENKTKK